MGILVFLLEVLADLKFPGELVVLYGDAKNTSEYSYLRESWNMSWVRVTGSWCIHLVCKVSCVRNMILK